MLIYVMNTIGRKEKNSRENKAGCSDIFFTVTTKAGKNSVLTKRITLREDGGIEKDASECRMWKGTAEKITVPISDFGSLLRRLKPNQALVHGVGDYNKARIVSGRRLKTKPGETPQRSKNGLPIISRTKAFFHYPNGPGVGLLDHDSPRPESVALDPKARFMRVRREIKAANGDVLLKELDRDIYRVSPVRKSFQSSQSSSSSLSIPYPSLSPSLKENLLHIQRVLVVKTDKGANLAPESEAAALFAETLHGLYAFSMAGLGWYRFDECCWLKCPAADFEVVLNALLYPATDGLGFSNNYQNGISQLLQKSGRNPLPDPPPGTIPFQNGLLDQESGELLPVTSDNAHTWVLPYEYSPDADCPNFLAWLTKALDNDPESVQLIRAWFNALFTGRPDLQVFLHLIGPAGTGKSTFGRLAFELVGKKNTTTTTLKELENNKFETANIHGKRLSAIEEADKYGGSVSVFKAMTGQGLLRLERKNQQQEGSFIYEGQTLMMSNERLATTDYTSGIERRRITVEFSRRISPEELSAWDKRGGERAILYNEAPGIINWALRLSREEVTDIFRAVPERVRRANLDAAMFNNPVFAWMAENLLPDSDSAVQVGTKKERREYGTVFYEGTDERLYPNYLTWCRENGRESVSLQRFSASVVDAAQTQGVQAEKRRAAGGVTKIFGLRIRREGEKSWLDILENSESEGVKEGVKAQVKDKVLIMKKMKTVKTENSSYKGNALYTGASEGTKQVEVEF